MLVSQDLFLMFNPYLVAMIQCDEHIFQMGGSTTNWFSLQFFFVLCAQMHLSSIWALSWGLLNQGTKRQSYITEENSRRQESLQLKERSLPSSLVYLLLGVPNRELDTNKHHSHLIQNMSFFLLFFSSLY